MTQVQWLKRLLSDSSRRKQIGSAWPLFFHLLFSIDEKGKWTTTYEQLSRELGLAKPTVKTWRKLLVDNSVAKSYMGKHSVTFELLEPFLPTAVLSGEKKNEGQAAKGGDKGMKVEPLHEGKPAADSMTLAPLIGLMVDLAQRITKLEMQVALNPDRIGVE